MQRTRQRVVDGPLQGSHTLAHGTIGQTGALRQVFQRAGNALVCVERLSALINPLLLRRGPSAITRLVIAFSVDAINRVLGRWARSHVRVEVGEVVQPSLTHPHPASTVACEVSPRHARAAVDHVRPSSVFRRLGQAMRGFRAQHLSLDAPTRVRASEIVNLNGLLRAARASHQRAGMCAVRFVSNNRQSTVRRADGESWHSAILPYFAHGME